jgi:outer membrane protein assembly factor BamD (BamD/ComL family)
MRTKVKLTKQQIKEDKFTNYMLLSRDWIVSNWQIMAIVGAILVISVVAIIYFTKMQSTKKVEASERLARAISEYRRQNYQVAILELKNLADEQGGEIGASALINLGNCYFDSKNYDEAINSFQRYYNEYKHDDPLTAASALAAVALSLENKREFLAAGDKFMEAIRFMPDSPGTPDYYVGAVRNYSLGGDFTKAETMLGELKDKFPGTEYIQNATTILMQSKTQ